MKLGSPVVLREGNVRTFDSLRPISFQRDDPNSFNETLLQDLIDSTPGVLPIREFLPSTTTLFSLGREIPVDIGGSEGSSSNGHSA